MRIRDWIEYWNIHVVVRMCDGGSFRRGFELSMRCKLIRQCCWHAHFLIKYHIQGGLNRLKIDSIAYFILFSKFKTSNRQEI